MFIDLILSTFMATTPLEQFRLQIEELYAKESFQEILELFIDSLLDKYRDAELYA